MGITAEQKAMADKLVSIIGKDEKDFGDKLRAKVQEGNKHSQQKEASQTPTRRQYQRSYNL